MIATLTVIKNSSKNDGSLEARPKKKFSNVSLPYDQSANEEVRAMNLIYIVYPSGRITAHLKESQFNK